MSQQEQQQQLQQQQQQSQDAQASVKTSPEEEALKRNTDCVYFLASPLTCKKGSECVYRHSEYARMNPRDCYYWMNGNCLNPKCTFRHPPLDSFLGTQPIAPSGPALTPSAPPSQTVTMPQTNTPYPKKHPVPCVYFQSGYCFRGDKCAFLHGPNPSTYKAQQAGTGGPTGELPTLKKASGGFVKCTQEKKTPQENVLKSVKPPANIVPAPNSETAPPRNGVSTRKSILQPAGTDGEHHAHRQPPFTNGNSVIRSSHLHPTHVSHPSDNQSVHSTKDADECFRESSPGFDVLVDDELGETDYYNSEDQYGRPRDHEERNLDSAAEYESGHSAEYRSTADIDQEMYQERWSYDKYGMQGQHAWADTTSSDRFFAGASDLDRRKHPRSESPGCIDNSDLRHRLLKQRRVNGLRSVVNRDYAHGKHGDAQSHRSSSRRNSPPLRHESSLSSRLRGRIKLPENNSPVYGSERATDRASNWGRSSNMGSQMSARQGRLRDRLKGRVQEDYDHEERMSKGSGVRRERMGYNNADFSRPKSLAELKNKDRNMKGLPNSEIQQQSEHGLTFESPKPLSEILKRKRQAGSSGSAPTGPSATRENIKERENQEGSSKNELVVERKNQVPSSQEESKSMTHASSGSGGGKTEGSNVNNESEIVTEDGEMVGEEGLEEYEYDADGQREEEDFDYEQGDDGDYNYEEGENVEGEEEYVEDEDGDDDFAKKIGVMYS